MARKFCVMTVGRSGSTSLMEAIGRFEDVALPGKDIECEDQELLHQKRVRGYMKQYAALAGGRIAGQGELIEAFYRLNAKKPYAGFKSMPDRHADFAAFSAREDIQFITIQRRDYASTAASFLRAQATGTWRRHGEARGDRWRFDAKRDGKALKANLAYIHGSRARLDGVPGAIHLYYEDLCEPGYASLALDEFFGRPLRFLDPRPATVGASYVENWEEFSAFAAAAWSALDAKDKAGKETGRKEAGRKEEVALENLEAFCVVLGTARSGFSLVAALLDAHPEAIVSREHDVLQQAEKGTAREPLFALLAEGARRAAEPAVAARERAGPVTGQSQGRARRPRLIGGMAGESPGKQDQDRAAALKHLRKETGLKLKVIHVLRNPVDLVSLLADRLKKPVAEILTTWSEAAHNTRKLLQGLTKDECAVVCYEDLAADPVRVLGELCAFLGLDAPRDYLEACARAVKRMPPEERPEVPWTTQEADRMREALKSLGLEPLYGKSGAPPKRAPRQARVKAGRVFYAWELGMDLGHLLRFLAPALKLRERGHEVVFAVRDLSNAEQTLGRHGFALMQAPIWIAPTHMPPGPPVNYTEIILRYGFMEYLGLKALVKAWRELFRHAQPGLVLTDHSPTALLAARSMGLAHAPIGSGFFNPPLVNPLPPMRYWTKAPPGRAEQCDAIALRNCNRVLADLGGPPLRSMADLFRADDSFLCTFAELDHYPGRGRAHYWGPTFEVEQGVEAAWPEGEGARVFAYLKPRYPGVDKVLEALSVSNTCVIAYIPGISPADLKKFSSPRMIISREPLKLKPILPDCDLAISHGGPGTVTAALLRGVPLLALPTQLEQFLTARRIKEMGAGLYADFEPRKPKEGEKKPAAPDFAALIRRLLEEPGFRAKARAFAQKYKNFSQAAQAHALATRIEQLLQS